MRSRYWRTVAATLFSIALLLVSFGDLRFGENVAIAKGGRCNDEGRGCARVDFDCPGPQPRRAERSDYIVYAKPIPVAWDSAATPNDEYSPDYDPGYAERPEPNLPVQVASNSIVAFELSVILDPYEYLIENDEVSSVTGAPTVRSSDDDVFRVVSQNEDLVEIEVLQAGEATLLIEWDGLNGERTIHASVPTGYELGFDATQFIEFPPRLCGPRNNGRNTDTAYMLLAREELIFTVTPRRGGGTLFGEVSNPLKVIGIDRVTQEKTSFSDTVRAGSNGQFVYVVPPTAAGELVQISSGEKSNGSTLYFSVVPNVDELQLRVNADNRCSEDEFGVIICSYPDLNRVRTMRYPMSVIGRVEDDCISKSNRCNIRLQVTVSIESDDDSDVATISSPCLTEGLTTCTSTRACDVAVDGNFALTFENGATASVRASYGGLMRDLTFEPVPAQ